MHETRSVPRLVGACGFYCGSCPTYLRGDCPGCRDTVDNPCFTYVCATRRGVDFCGACSAFPCEDLLTREKVTVVDKAWLRWKQRELHARRDAHTTTPTAPDTDFGDGEPNS